MMKTNTKERSYAYDIGKALAYSLISVLVFLAQNLEMVRDFLNQLHAPVIVSIFVMTFLAFLAKRLVTPIKDGDNKTK